jgi:hypothetical protein
MALASWIKGAPEGVPGAGLHHRRDWQITKVEYHDYPIQLS